MNEEELELDFHEDEEFERKIEAPKYERTRPDFPTEGPGDGRTWHEYFKDIRREREEGGSTVPRMEVQITREAHDVSAEELAQAPSTIRAYAKLAEANGFRVAVRASSTHRTQGYYLSKTHERYGEPRDDQKPEDRILWWVVGTKANTAWFYFSVLQRPGGNETSSRHWFYTMVSDKELKQRIKGEYIEPTSGD